MSLDSFPFLLVCVSVACKVARLEPVLSRLPPILERGHWSVQCGVTVCLWLGHTEILPASLSSVLFFSFHGTHRPRYENTELMWVRREVIKRDTKGFFFLHGHWTKDTICLGVQHYPQTRLLLFFSNTVHRHQLSSHQHFGLIKALLFWVIKLHKWSWSYL